MRTFRDTASSGVTVGISAAGRTLSAGERSAIADASRSPAMSHLSHRGTKAKSATSCGNAFETNIRRPRQESPPFRYNPSKLPTYQYRLVKTKLYSDLQMHES